MNILVLGSGGREHSLCWKLRKSPRINKLFIAPGNAGTAIVGENINLGDGGVNDFNHIGKLCIENNVNMLVVGPEEPLVQGIHNDFQQNDSLRNIIVIGPTKEGAILEGSKNFAKKFMQRYGIPTAKYESFSKDRINEADLFLRSLQPPFVLKADGLASGKGVIICQSIAEAKEEIKEILINEKFGKAGMTVVIEQFLKGIELSVIILTDGVSYKILPPAKDYKRIGEGDTGLNTGGMGAVSPVPFANNDFLEKVEKKIIIPTLNGLKKENICYKGFLYFGLMNVDGEPYVLEYNVRMGDPEAEVILPRIKTDLVELFIAVNNQTLNNKNIEIDERFAVTVMCVSSGYPLQYEKGKEITGLDYIQDSIIFHAGTKIENGKILTNGGRVLSVTSYGNTMKDALRISYKNIEKINYDGKYFRRDIGWDL